jgi:hypothetical protein
MLLICADGRERPPGRPGPSGARPVPASSPHPKTLAAVDPSRPGAFSDRWRGRSLTLVGEAVRDLQGEPCQVRCRRRQVRAIGLEVR